MPDTMSPEQQNLTLSDGRPAPFGVSWTEEGINFALYSKYADQVTLHLVRFDTGEPLAEIALDPERNRTGNAWHICIKGLPDRCCYGYRLDKIRGRSAKKFCVPDKILLDPYAKALNTPKEWGQGGFPYQPLGLVIPNHEFDWQGDRPLEIPLHESILYEMHIRGFTHHSSSGVENPGTYLGVVEKIPYLKDLGINGVKIMPLHEFNEAEYKRFNPMTGERLWNYWGYSTVNFFSPMNRYASKSDFASSLTEFKTMVRELHKAGIEVILDVVFNHTAEGDQNGPVISFKGIDCPTYYLLDRKQNMMNFSGCGNTVNCNHPIVRDLILAALRYWVVEMHVDGFRFDLAAILCRGTQGEPLANAPLIERISQDPVLAGSKMIVEPWDIGGLYMLGQFYPQEDRFTEWNDKFREGVRGFVKGDMGTKRDFAIRICGSQDLFGGGIRSPTASLNFITAHDGFTLRDLVSYNDKHNSANAEDNRDGNPSNRSWNCGAEGETGNPDVIALRHKQMRNLHLALMLSLGVPMLTMGNEYCHTRYGNNNPWCQDNELNWFLWDEIEKNGHFFRFYKELIYFRKRHPMLRSPDFYSPEHVVWHSHKPNDPDWDGDTQLIVYTIDEEDHQLFIAFNMHHFQETIQLPTPPEAQNWHRVVCTSSPPPEDFINEMEAPLVELGEFSIEPHTAVVMISKG